MDAKLTVSFDEEVIRQAKDYASQNGLSLSRMLEFLLRKVVSSKERQLYDWPIADWVKELAEGPVEYRATPLTNKEIRAEVYEHKLRRKSLTL